MPTSAYDKLSLIDFSDGRPLAIAWDGCTLLLDYENWKEQVVRFRFTNVAYLSGYGCGGSLCSAEVSCDAPEIETVKKNARR